MAAAHAAAPRGFRRRWRWAGLAAAALAVAGIDQALHAWLARRGSPVGPAAWIWAWDPIREATPRAFFLARDFELEAAPASATVAVAGDEEYLLYLNGRRVGSGAYAEGAPLDRYEVGELLVAGGNRLVAELRSTRGVGGFLLSLQVGQEGPPVLVVSDGAWRVVRKQEAGLLAGWLGLEASAPPKVWGVPPVGRWGRPAVGPPRPVPPPLAGPGAPVPAAEESRSEPGPSLRAALFDWGREQTGYLILELPPGGFAPALLFVGEGPPDPASQPAAGFVLAPPGTTRWRGAVPRRFRCALVLGPEAPGGAWLEPAPPETVPARAPPPSVRGVFGLLPPPRQPWLEADIRRRLRVAGPAAERP